MKGMADRRPIAIVTPWFGRDLRGGAELQAWNLAQRLAARGYAVEVLTTCCRSFHEDWSENHHAPGLETVAEGFVVRRFPVAPRDRPAFDRVCGYLLGLDRAALKPGVSPISESDERVFCEHLIRCPALLSYLEQDGAQYGAFIFLPYLYGPILDGLPLVASRAFLQPCLHDEAYAYLRCVQRVALAARHILWLSEGEFALGRRLFGPAMLAKSTVGMAGVEPAPLRAEAPQALAIVPSAPFLLMLGRKDPGKGTMLAVDAFRAHHRQRGGRLRLVVAGPGDVLLADPGSNIDDLGLVSEEQRHALLQKCTALVQPSPNESFSRVMFEAWQCGRPVLARRSCLATACAVESSGGGWLAETVEEWSALFAKVEVLSEEERDAAGRRGAAFGEATADWERVMDRYDEVLRPLVRDPGIGLRVKCALTAVAPQTVRLLAGDVKIGSWSLRPGEVTQSDWMEARVSCSEPALRFETNRTGAEVGRDPRTLGFSLQRIETESLESQAVDLCFERGWNRSEAGPGTAAPRWSTGSATILVRSSREHGDKRAIHQVLPNLSYGDAIGNHTRWIRDRLQALGYVSEIYARHIGAGMRDQAYPLSGPAAIAADAAVIYHHSIGTEITPWICGHPGSKALIYHNITPADFFEPYRPDFAAICRQGRAELPGLAPYFPVNVGVSRFNADELASCGFRDPGILPLCVDPAYWAFPPDEQVMAGLQDGRTNILFVGRIVPNKRHEDIIYTFKFWLEDDPGARLFLVGTAEVSSFYLDCLQELARRLRVDHAVYFVGHVNDAQLHAYYRCASMFWCFSEHEGFCMPLIEACAFGVPVVARAEGAVADTLGDAGLLLPVRSDPAATARYIAANRPTDHVKMRSRVERYSAPIVTAQLHQLVDKLLGPSQPMPGTKAELPNAN